MNGELVMVVPRAGLFAAAPAFHGLRASAEAHLSYCLSNYLFMPRRRAESSPDYKQVIPYVVLAAPGPAGGPVRYLIFQRVAGGDPRLGRLYSIGLGGHVNAGDAAAMVRGSAPGSPLGTRREQAAERTAPPRLPERRAPGGRRLLRQLFPAPALRDLLERSAGAGYLEHPLLRGIQRELREEVILPSGCRLSMLGAINDDSNAVGQVHFGLAFLLALPVPAAASQVRLRAELTTEQAGGWLSLDDVSAYTHAMETWSALLLESGALPQTIAGDDTGQP